MSLWILRRNTRLCLVFRFLLAMFFGMPFMVVYYKSHGLSQVDVNAIQSIIAIVGLITVIPGGYLADRIGARRMLLGGTTLIALSALVFAFCDALWEFELVSVVSSFGWWSIDGVTSSLVAANVKIATTSGICTRQWYERYESHTTQVSAAGVLVGIGFGWIIEVWGGMSLVFALQPIIYVGALGVAWRLVESKSMAAAEARQYVSPLVMVRIAKAMLWESPAIRWLVAISAVLHVSTLGAFWLFQPKMAHEGIPLGLFGAVYAGRALGSLLFARLGEKRMLEAGTIGGLTMMVLVFSTSVLFAALVGGWPGVAALFIGSSFMGAFALQVERVALNKLLSDSVTNRTCELSVSTMVQALAFACLSPFIGMAAEAYSVDIALFLLAAGCLVGARISLTLLRRVCLGV